jgi:hypothetical protein
MADFKPNPGSFLPFLESSEPEDPSFPSASQSPLTLLEILAGQAQRSLYIFDLHSLSRMDPWRYGAALTILRDTKCIEIIGDAPDQTVRLSDTGAALIQIMRPA